MVWPCTLLSPPFHLLTRRVIYIINVIDGGQWGREGERERDRDREWGMGKGRVELRSESWSRPYEQACRTDPPCTDRFGMSQLYRRFPFPPNRSGPGGPVIHTDPVRAYRPEKQHDKAQTRPRPVQLQLCYRRYAVTATWKGEKMF